MVFEAPYQLKTGIDQGAVDSDSEIPGAGSHNHAAITTAAMAKLHLTTDILAQPQTSPRCHGVELKLLQLEFCQTGCHRPMQYRDLCEFMGQVPVVQCQPIQPADIVVAGAQLAAIEQAE